MKEYNTIIWKEEDEIGHLVLNQPPSNKMTSGFFNELQDLTKYVIPKSKVKAILVYGRGRHFSSGVELQDLLNTINVDLDINDKYAVQSFFIQNNQSFSFFDNLNIPVIAVIKGVCIGSAFELTLFCHIRICADNSLMALPESGFDLMPGCGGTQKLPQLIGIPKSMEFILSGENISDQKALEWGVADVVVSRKLIMDKAKEFAEFISNDYKRILKKKYIKDFFKHE